MDVMEDMSAQESLGSVSAPSQLAITFGTMSVSESSAAAESGVAFIWESMDEEAVHHLVAQLDASTINVTQGQSVKKDEFAQVMNDLAEAVAIMHISSGDSSAEGSSGSANSLDPLEGIAQSQEASATCAVAHCSGRFVLYRQLQAVTPSYVDLGIPQPGHGRYSVPVHVSGHVTSFEKNDSGGQNQDQGAGYQCWSESSSYSVDSSFAPLTDTQESGSQFQSYRNTSFLAEHRRRPGRMRKMCIFCRSNKETARLYRSHTLHDNLGNVSCPILRNYVCPICQATGDQAHTRKHCPKLRSQAGAAECLETTYIGCRNAAGKYVVIKYY